MPHLSRLAAVFLVTVLLPFPVLATGWYNPGPWETTPFTTDTKDLAKAAAKNRPGSAQPVTLLFEEGSASFTTDGSVEVRDYLVYRIETEDGRKNWSESNVSWDAWFQDMPTLRVRILQPDGTVLTVGNPDLIEVPSGGQDQVYDSTRRFRAPFPQVTIGSLIEEEVVQTTRPYLPGAGSAITWSFRRSSPAGLTRYTVSNPTPLSVQVSAPTREPVKFRTSTLHDVFTRTWESWDVTGNPPLEDHTPSDARQRFTIVASSSPSWTSLASLYGREVERVLALGGLSLPADLRLPRGDARSATLAASRWINSHVRYTALEFGQNAIVPYPPSEVLTRGFGDCKDKASLLVALLRSAGYDAAVGLLNSGRGWDITPEVSTLTYFNHAIVYVGGEGFWFDPTVEITRDIDLPIDDQGRRILLTGTATPGLQRTPVSNAGSNVLHEIRTYRLAEDGNGSLALTTILSGAFDQFRRNRALFDDRSRFTRDLIDDLVGYLDAKTAPEVRLTDPTDFNSPMGWHVDLGSTGKVETFDDGAQVHWGLRNLLNELPNELTDDNPPPRSQPFQGGMAFTYLLDLYTEPAPGFEATELPQAVEEDRPGYHYTEDWSVTETGTVAGKVVFTFKDIEVSAQGFAEYRASFDEFVDAYLSHRLNFVHRGDSLRAEGRVTEAVGEYLRLVNDQPGNAIRARRLSQALEAASLAEPALDFAARATALDPSNPAMWENLGDVLSRNELGQRLVDGFQRDRAIGAYQRALDLAPESEANWANLAVLYSVDAHGSATKNQDDLALARQAFAHVTTKLADFELVEDAWKLAIRAGDLAEARRLVPKFADVAARSAALVVTESVAGSKSSVTRYLDASLTTEQRQGALQTAAQQLMLLRRYPEAARLFRQSGVGNRNVAALDNYAALLERIEVWNHPPEGDGAAELIGQLMYALTAEGHRGPEVARTYFLDGADLTEPRQLEFLGNIQQGLGRTLGGIGQDVAADFLLSLLHVEAREAVPGLVRADISTPVSDQSWRFYLLRQPEGLKVLDAREGSVSGGRQMQRWLQEGRLTEARDFFQWAFVEGDAGQAPIADPRFADQPWILNLGALVLLEDPGPLWAELRDTPSFESHALEAGVPAAKVEELRASLLRDLCYFARQRENWRLQTDVARLLAGLPDAPTSDQWLLVRSLLVSGDLVEASSLAEALALARAPDAEQMGTLFALYAESSDFKALDRWTAKLESRLSSHDLNNLAWYELFRKDVDLKRALDRALRSVNRDTDATRASLHTLATVYAALGRFDEARAVLLKSLGATDGLPQADDWYVIGLIAKGLGFTDSARSSFEKVLQATVGIQRAVSTALLARRQLVLIGTAP